MALKVCQQQQWPNLQVQLDLDQFLNPHPALKSAAVIG
jgi:hypothetical protein